MALTAAQKRPLPPEFEIKENFPREMGDAELRRIRSKTIDEIKQVILYPDLPQTAFEPNWNNANEDDDQSAVTQESRLPFGERVIIRGEEDQAEMLRRTKSMEQQLTVSARYVEQQMEIDREVSGIRLPVKRVKRLSKHDAVIYTKNSWGSTEYGDEDMRHALRARFTAEEGFDEVGYENALQRHLACPPDTSADLPVLNEEDHVEIFDADDNFLGRGVVRDATGDAVRFYLHLHPKARLKAGCTLRKKSNMRTLDKHAEFVRGYAKRLGVEQLVTKRDGTPYWTAQEEPTDDRGDDYQYDYDDDEDSSASRSSYGRQVHGKIRKERKKKKKKDWTRELLRTPEMMFFGRVTHKDCQKSIRESWLDRRLNSKDIPGLLLDDPEQCAAFALGAGGYPCFVLQGPPGTGKTTVASLLLRHLQDRGLKTLVVSHSNKGLDVLLRAAKKRDVNVSRGGTEQKICAKDLRDDFIRKNLHHPQKPDFMFEGIDEEAYEEAIAAFERGERDDTPTREEFTGMILDKRYWGAACEKFREQKDALVKELQTRRGLVAGVTLNSLLSDEIIDALDFDVVIVDEASKGYLYEMLPALKKAGKQIIFIGDHKQLGNIDIPPHLKNFLKDAPPQKDEQGDGSETDLGEDRDGNFASDDDDQGHGYSIPPIDADAVATFDDGPFAYMAEKTSIPHVMLSTDRRSLKDIVAIISHGAYGGKLRAGRVDNDDPENTGELIWVDTSSRPDRGEESAGNSRTNRLEARLIARQLRKDFEHGELAEEDFGVITMYRAQGALIREMARRTKKTSLKNALRKGKLIGPDAPADAEARIAVITAQQEKSHEAFMKLLAGKIATVDAYQGSEADRVDVATTRCNDEGKRGFLDNPRRLNVAFSRARNKLVIYGDKKTLIDDNTDEESRRYFEAAYKICQARGTVIDAHAGLPARFMLEETKSQTHSAKRNRARRAWRRQRKEEARASATETWRSPHDTAKTSVAMKEAEPTSEHEEDEHGDEAQGEDDR